MAYSVSINKQLSVSADPIIQPAAVRLVITVTGVTDFADQGIFLYAIDPATEQLEYTSVVSPVDLTTIPYNTVDALNVFVRRNILDLIFPTAEQANLAIARIEADIQSLCSNMALLATLQTPVAVTIGE